MKNKSLVLVAFLIFSTIAGYAGTRNRYEVPVNQAVTAASTELFKFDPPIVVNNGLSVDISSQTSTFTVCVREADGDL